MNSYDRQRELEMSSVTRGVDRYFATLQADQERDREFDSSVGQSVVSQMVTRTYPEVLELQKTAKENLVAAQTSGRRLQGWEMAVAISDPYKLAYIAVRSAVAKPKGAAGSDRTAIGSRIGQISNLELQWLELREGEHERAADAGERSRIALLKREVKQINPRSVKKWLRRLDDITTTDWGQEVQVKLGLTMLALVLKACDEFLELLTYKEQKGAKIREVSIVQLKESVRRHMDISHDERSDQQPWMLPMIHPPRPWTIKGGSLIGGYLTIDSPMVKDGTRRGDINDPLSLDDRVPLVVRKAINLVNKTQWQVNAGVLAVAQQAAKEGRGEVLPVAPPIDMIADAPMEEWAKMTTAERGAIKNQRRDIHDHNHRLQAHREDMWRQLAVAEEFMEEPVIYFPHTLDFRGRAYPLPQDLNPQGSDFAKSLLTFADSKPLGPDGFRWLSYHVAACYGMDKVSRPAQIEWVNEFMDNLSDVASDPFGVGYEFWCKAEEPWQFLAGAIELERAYQHPEGIYEYPCALPVYVDGSCNGLQHLSAMGLDAEGAFATNLTTCPERQDIYNIVADKVNAQIEHDCYMYSYSGKPGGGSNCPELAPSINWRTNVNRKTVKRGVMTVPYGLTDIGMRDQLIVDRWTKGVEGDTLKNANYLRDRMKEAISATVTRATEIMAWMQDNGTILAHHNKPVEWTSPSGFRVRQAYYMPTSRRVTTLLGRTTLLRAGTGAAGRTIRARKQTLSIVPNIIHSFDAAHMTLTIHSAGLRGFDAIAVVHDSFGCHACDMERFLPVVREEFVNIYRQNWFEALQAEFKSSVGDDVPMISPPNRGDFDIEQVHGAQFFFA